MNRLRHLQFLFGLFLLIACKNLDNIQISNELPPMYPDYTNIMIPCNIAPLNFILRDRTQSIEVILKGKFTQTKFMGRDKMQFSESRWRKFLQTEKGNTVTVQVTVRIKGKSIKYQPFEWKIVEDKIDPYLTYRLIEQGFKVSNKIRLCERNLESFSERVIADNNLTEFSCMNGHILGNQNPNLSFFYIQGEKGGLVLNRNGILRKINTQANSTGESVAYGNFHPSGRYGVFSANLAVQDFHTLASKKLEVYDKASDLLILDFDNNRVIQSPLTSGDDKLETFPVFSADGNRIFYCVTSKKSLPDSIKQLKYSLCSISFDAKLGQFGNSIDTLLYMAGSDKSVSFPKPSPDGRFLLYCVSDYGTFPIWHRETDLQMMNLNSGVIFDLQTVNSDYSETYHSWSSNSRWFVFASKRDDGLYEKPYFCYVDANGKAHKPFVLPQKEPHFYDYSLKSFNIPELSTGKLPFSASDIERVYWKESAEGFK